MSSEFDLNQEKASEAFEDCMNLIQDLHNWALLSSSADITIYTCPTASGLSALKTESYIDKSYSELSEHCWSHWAEYELTLWDSITHIEYIKEYDDGSKIRLDRTKPFGSFPPREVHLFYSKQQLDENTIALLATSSPSEFNLSQHYVKGEIKFSIQIFEALNQDTQKTHIITLDQIDPKDNLPATIVNEINLERAKFYQALVNKLKSL